MERDRASIPSPFPHYCSHSSLHSPCRCNKCYRLGDTTICLSQTCVRSSRKLAQEKNTQLWIEYNSMKNHTYKCDPINGRLGVLGFFRLLASSCWLFGNPWTMSSRIFSTFFRLWEFRLQGHPKALLRQNNSFAKNHDAHFPMKGEIFMCVHACVCTCLSLSFCFSLLLNYSSLWFTTPEGVCR